MHNSCVITVNYRGTTDTVRCVKSLLESTVPVEIVVVDTTPNDPDLEAALCFADGAILLMATENVGFGRANNLGIEWALAHSSCDYFFLLNNDAAIYPESIQELENAMRAHLDVGIMVPRIVYLDDPDTLWYGGGVMDWRRASAFTPGHNRDARTPLAMTERDVTFATGCALFIRRSVLQSLRGFDPQFFMYEEDVEFCLRAAEGGIRIRYIPCSLVLHRAQGSNADAPKGQRDYWSTKNPRLSFYAFHIIRNRLVNVRLHARGKNLLTAVVFFPLFIIRRMIPFLLGGRLDAVAAMFRGIADSWRAARNAGANK